MSTPNPPMNLLEAIATQEGFYALGTLAQRNHNPGNIISGTFSTEHGAITITSSLTPLAENGYAVFPDDETGFAALRALLTGPAYRGLTVELAINRYCPPPVTDQPLTEGNNPDVYVRNVCLWCECEPSTIIDSLIPAGEASIEPTAPVAGTVQ